MAYQTIPLTANPSQTLDIVLSEQFVSLVLQTRQDNLFIDVYLDGVAIVRGRICRDRQKIVNEEYRGFSGELFFMDTAGGSDPIYSGIGSRYLLIYWDGENE